MEDEVDVENDEASAVQEPLSDNEKPNDRRVPQQSRSETTTPSVGLDPATKVFVPRMEQNDENVVPSSRASTPATSATDNLFFVDTIGDKVKIPQTQLPIISLPSPARSDSSDEDEVLFHGRTPLKASVVDDPVSTPPQPATRDTTAAIVKQGLLEGKVLTEVSASENSWDDTAIEWVHRSKPGVGWSAPKLKKKAAPQSRLLKFRVDEQQTKLHQDTTAVDDYLANVREHDPEFLQIATFAQRQLDVELADGGHVQQQFKSLSMNASKKSKVTEQHQVSSSDEIEDADDSQSDFVQDEDVVFDALSDSDESDEDDEDDGEDDVDDIEDDEDELDADDRMDVNVIDDETLALLLSKQEELGIGSDELLLYDDGVDASVARAAKRYAKETPKKSRSKGKGSFPSATLLADVLDQDPYGGFDVMNFERPSLRKKKGRKALDFDVSDDELRESLESAWQNDRNKKKERKLEREELRAQGLLGSKSVNNRYGEGLTIWQIGKEFQTFLGSDEMEKAFPPMDKKRRKMIHEIAAVFNCKTKSVGAGSNRFTRLVKTRKTTPYMEHLFVARARKINMGFFPRSDVGAKGKQTSRLSGRGGASNSAGVRYQDGDIVGGTAPEIGAENKGRAMLEKMGWSSGMALGALDNKGILQPIAHVVKNTKTGLG